MKNRSYKYIDTKSDNYKQAEKEAVDFYAYLHAVHLYKSIKLETNIIGVLKNGENKIKYREASRKEMIEITKARLNSVGVEFDLKEKDMDIEKLIIPSVEFVKNGGLFKPYSKYIKIGDESVAPDTEAVEELKETVKELQYRTKEQLQIYCNENEVIVINGIEHLTDLELFTINHLFNINEIEKIVDSILLQ